MPKTDERRSDAHRRPGPAGRTPRTTDSAPRLRDTTGGRWVLGVVGIVVVLSVVRAAGPFTYPGDLWRQTDTASIARNFAENGMNIFFPQINWGGAGPGYVETEFPLMPWLAAALYLVTGEHTGLGRLISLAFMLVGTAAFWGLARRLLPATAARWALVAFAVSPTFMRWGTAFMPEATVLAFTLLALLAFCRWLQEDRPGWLVAAAAATSAAALAKPTSLHVGLVMALWLVFAARDRLRRPGLYVAGLAALVAPALWVWHAAGLHATYGNTFGVVSGGDSKWGSPALWLSPDFYLGLLSTEALFVYGIVGIPLALIGVGWLWRHRHGEPAAAFLAAGAIALLVYYFATGRYSGSDLGIQYHVYSLPYAAAATGLGLAVLQRWVRPRMGGLAFAAVASATVLALSVQSLDILRESLMSNAGGFGTCAAELDEVSAHGDLVVVGTTSTSTMDGVPNNFQEPIIFYLADRKGWSLPADGYDPAFVQADMEQGARFFVNPDPDLLATDGPLAAWLDSEAVQVRTDDRDGCDIWALPNPD